VYLSSFPALSAYDLGVQQSLGVRKCAKGGIVTTFAKRRAQFALSEFWRGNEICVILPNMAAFLVFIFVFHIGSVESRPSR
jgi:hypothetical protein